MLTCADDPVEWMSRCCLCDDYRSIKHCGWCGHDFCDDCRYSGARVKEALNTAIGRSKLHCGGGRHG